MPVFITTGEEMKLTKIALHGGVRDLDGNMHDILYAGTTTGVVMKILISSKNPDKKMSQVLERFQVFNTTDPVLHIHIVDPSGPDSQLVILSKDSAKTIHLHSCHLDHQHCGDCLARHSPYCAWDTLARECVALLPRTRGGDIGGLLQQMDRCQVDTGRKGGEKFHNIWFIRNILEIGTREILGKEESDEKRISSNWTAKQSDILTSDKQNTTNTLCLPCECPCTEQTQHRSLEGTTVGGRL